jgi:phage anti-repressor protein
MTPRQFSKMKKNLMIAYQEAFKKWSAISDENSTEKQNAFTDLTIALDFLRTIQMVEQDMTNQRAR